MILVMPHPCGTGAGQKFGRFQPEPSQKHAGIYSQNTKHGTAEPFHLLHMAPMSAVVMLRGLCVADFGHATPLWHWRWTKIWQIYA
jgi:hypothetical protein